MRLKDSTNYGRTLYFGDGSYAYITEDSDDHLNIYASNGLTLSTNVTANSKLQVYGNLVADGTYAFMPMNSDGYGLYFHGLNLSIHNNHSYVAPLFSLNTENRIVFSQTPMIQSIGYLATQVWVAERYLPLTGGTINGSLNIKYSNADILTLYRTATSGGAFVKYLGMNQTSLGWGAGSSSGHEFVWMYFTYGDLANGTIYMTLDKSGNLLTKGSMTFQSTSDKRLKSNIRNFNACEELMSLGGVYKFEYNENEVKRNPKYKGTHIGLIYQNVKGTSLERMCMEREDGFGSLNYIDTSFISLLAGVGMEHETRIQRLERENKELRMEVERLKRM